MPGQQTVDIRDLIPTLTGGRPYVFVVRAFGERWDLYRRIKRMVEDEIGLACIDAEEVPGAGHDLLAKVHLLVRRAELVVAEISTNSPNVFYETGYATALGKPLLLVIEEGAEVPANLRGSVFIQYRDDRDGLERFERRLAEVLRFVIKSQVPLLRDMLQPEIAQPAYIVASPKYPGRDSRIQGQVYDQRTFGDNLGIRGLISAFGLMLGEAEGVELISAQHSPPDLVDRPLSLYPIGSPKVNWVTRVMLDRLQGGREPNWVLAAAPGRTEEGDYPVALYRTVRGVTESLDAVLDEVHTVDGTATVFVEDWGIVVRGPHRDHPDRLVLVMAGGHSLGTGAACLAATRSPLIKQIAMRRKDKCDADLADKRAAFWVLVRGKASASDTLLDMEGVSVEDVGVYD